MTALILARGGKKYRKNEEKATDLTVEIYYLCKRSIKDAVYYGKNGIWNINTINKMVDKLESDITSIVNKNKSDSYKEGFWNGQKAKIEEVKFDIPKPTAVTPEEIYKPEKMGGLFSQMVAANEMKMPKTEDELKEMMLDGYDTELITKTKFFTKLNSQEEYEQCCDLITQYKDREENLDIFEVKHLKILTSVCIDWVNKLNENKQNEYD